MNRRSRFAGFGLVEVLVALAILLILASMALPTLAVTLDRARVESAAAQLQVVRDALYKPGGGSDAFFQTVGANAGRLSELVAPIVANNSSYASGTDNSCGQSFSNKQANNWEDEGPYVNFNIDRAAGMATPIGNATDSLTRVPNNANPGNLIINFLNTVSEPDAVLLDAVVDGGNGSVAGTIRWLAPVDGMVRLSYLVPVNSSC
jgi:prepilin-type N-terminal cleavage/methylation domain-containing protein